MSLGNVVEALGLDEKHNMPPLTNPLISGATTLIEALQLIATEVTNVAGTPTFQGVWDAATNTPVVLSGVGAKAGVYYSVTVAGNTSLDGISSWQVGDQAVFSGTVWQKIPAVVSGVTSVAGRTGVITLGKSDITGLNASLDVLQNISEKNAASGYAGLDSYGKISVSVLPALSAATNVTVNASDVVGLSVLLTTRESTTNKGVANGYAGLDTTGVVPLSQLPLIPASKLESSGNFAAVATSGLYGDLIGAPSLALVASTGDYTDLANLPNIPVAYTLPTASDTIKGGIIIGTGLAIDVDGVVTVPSVSQAVLSVNGQTGAVVLNLDTPIASATVAGISKAGYGLSVDESNRLNVNFAVESVAGKTGVVTLAADDITGLATVAGTGSYDDLLNKPDLASQYNLPEATASILGGIKVGSGLAVAIDGTLSNDAPQTVATTTAVGAVKVGAGLSVDPQGTLSVSVVSGVSSVAGRGGAVTLDYTDVSGLATVANTGSYLDLNGIPESYILPAAASNLLGGVKVGSGLQVDGSGVLSVAESAPIVFPVTSVAGKTGIITLDVADISGAQASFGFTPENVAGKNATSGYCGLDSQGKIGYDQLPSSLLGAAYQGAWNASTNTPAITNSTGTAGYYYKVSVAGTTNIDGVSDWSAGDTIIFNGSVWEKLNAYTPPVQSVFGRLGNVTLNSSDVTGALGFTPADTTDVVNSINGLKGAVVLSLDMFTSMAGLPHDVSWSVIGLPTAGESTLRMLTPRAFVIAANFAGSLANAYVAATSSASFVITKNNDQIATVTFAAGSTNGVFSTQGAVSFAIGDRITVYAPITQDATLADVDFAIMSILL